MGRPTLVALLGEYALQQMGGGDEALSAAMGSASWEAAAGAWQHPVRPDLGACMPAWSPVVGDHALLIEADFTVLPAQRLAVLLDAVMADGERAAAGEGGTRLGMRAPDGGGLQRGEQGAAATCSHHHPQVRQAVRQLRQPPALLTLPRDQPAARRRTRTQSAAAASARRR